MFDIIASDTGIIEFKVVNLLCLKKEKIIDTDKFFVIKLVKKMNINKNNL